LGSPCLATCITSIIWRHDASDKVFASYSSIQGLQTMRKLGRQRLPADYDYTAGLTPSDFATQSRVLRRGVARHEIARRRGLGSCARSRAALGVALLSKIPAGAPTSLRSSGAQSSSRTSFALCRRSVAGRGSTLALRALAVARSHDGAHGKRRAALNLDRRGAHQASAALSGADAATGGKGPRRCHRCRSTMAPPCCRGRALCRGGRVTGAHHPAGEALGFIPK
jgi:hypothetical protein